MERERQREKERKTDTHTHTHRDRERDRERVRQRERQRQRDRDRQTDRQRDREREKQRQREIEADLPSCLSPLITKSPSVGWTRTGTTHSVVFLTPNRVEQPQRLSVSRPPCSLLNQTPVLQRSVLPCKQADPDHRVNLPSKRELKSVDKVSPALQVNFL